MPSLVSSHVTYIASGLNGRARCFICCAVWDPAKFFEKNSRADVGENGVYSAVLRRRRWFRVVLFPHALGLSSNFSAEKHFLAHKPSAPLHDGNDRWSSKHRVCRSTQFVLASKNIPYPSATLAGRVDWTILHSESSPKNNQRSLDGAARQNKREQPGLS